MLLIKSSVNNLQLHDKWRVEGVNLVSRGFLQQRSADPRGHGRVGPRRCRKPRR